MSHLFWKQEKSYRIYFIVFHNVQLDGLDTCDKEVMWSVKITSSRVFSRVVPSSNFLPTFGKLENFLHLTDDEAPNQTHFVWPEARGEINYCQSSDSDVCPNWIILNQYTILYARLILTSKDVKRSSEETQPSNRSCLCCNKSPIWAIKSDYLISKMVSNEMCARAAVQLRRKFEEFYYYSAHDSE